jgi:hypothetical protein
VQMSMPMIMTSLLTPILVIPRSYFMYVLDKYTHHSEEVREPRVARLITALRVRWAYLECLLHSLKMKIGLREWAR